MGRSPGVDWSDYTTDESPESDVTETDTKVEETQTLTDNTEREEN